MYVIAVYDVGKKRCNKMLKVCRRFLIHIQNSVFEGEITEANLERLKAETLEIMDSNYDSFFIFKSRNEKWLDKEIIGNDKNPVTNLL